MKFKKFAALFCAAVCAMTTVAFANQSIKELGVTLNQEKNAEATIPEGSELIVTKINMDTPEATQASVKNSFVESDALTADQIAKIAEGVAKVNDPKLAAGEVVNPGDFMKKYAGVPADTKTMKCVNSDREVALDNLHFMAGFQNIGTTKDGGATVQVVDENGENIATNVVMSMDQIRSTNDLKGAAILVLDPKSGEPKLIDLEVVPVDTQTMDLTVPFPCLGTYALTQETPAAA